MQGIDFSLPWYHGSQEQLTKLRAGSSNTQNRDLAKAFSHRPSLVSMSDRGDGEVSPETFLVRHNGETPGFLYFVSGETGPDDVHPHPHPANATRWEWVTDRELNIELNIELVERTLVADRERLTGEEIAEIRRKQKERGEETFAE